MATKSNPIRCFEGNAKPHEPFWTITNTVENGEEVEAEIELYGYISEFSWLEDDITPQMFKSDLAKLGNRDVKLRINSFGGDLIAATMMHTMIRDYPGKVTVQIDGIAASAATIVAVAGDEVKIQNYGYFMIHDPSYSFFQAILNLETMARMVDSLQAAKEGVVNAYERKTGLSRDRLSKLMTNETWMDAHKAVDLGFVDSIVEENEKNLVVPANAAMVNAIQNYQNVPPDILKALQNASFQKVEEESSPRILSEEEEREAQILRERIETILRKE
jgi:ATP-dependent Clp protease protease subunit